VLSLLYDGEIKMCNIWRLHFNSRVEE